MAVGDARVDHRPSVAAGESSFVRLTIASAPSLSSLKTERVTPRAPNDPGFIYKLSPGIDLYPWMWAELQVAPGSFELSPPGRQRKPVIAGHAAEWVWALSPAQARGRQDLTIHIGTIVVPADSATELEVETTESIAIAIVVEPAAPTSTLPSAVTAARGDNIASILFVMLVIIGGVLALVVALIRQERAERGRKTG